MEMTKEELHNWIRRKVKKNKLIVAEVEKCNLLRSLLKRRENQAIHLRQLHRSGLDLLCALVFRPWLQSHRFLCVCTVDNFFSDRSFLCIDASLCRVACCWKLCFCFLWISCNHGPFEPWNFPNRFLGHSKRFNSLFWALPQLETCCWHLNEDKRLHMLHVYHFSCIIKMVRDLFLCFCFHAAYIIHRVHVLK